MTNNTLNNDTDLMTLGEVAKYLRLAERTVLNLVHKNEIPCIKIGNQWRFVKPVIDDWLLSKMNYQKLNYNDIKNWNIPSDISTMKINSFFDKDYILMDIKKGSKEEILRQLVKPLAARKIVVSENFHLMKLIERENLVSTGIGHGIAMPHLRNIKENPKNAPFMVFGICKEGADFGSLDGQPTFLFFLLCTKNEAVHLRIMAKISKVFLNDDIKNQIINAASPDDIISILNNLTIE